MDHQWRNSSGCSIFFFGIILFLCSGICNHGCSAVQFVPVGSRCSPKGSFQPSSQFEENVQSTLDALVNSANLGNAFKTARFGEGSDEIYGLLQCRGDTQPDLCSDCANTASNDIQQNCGNISVGARIWYEECFVRWEKYNFYHKLDLNSSVVKYNVENVENPGLFNKAVKELFSNLSKTVMGLPGTRYASGFTDSAPPKRIYALAQCWKDISMEDCSICMQNSLNSLYRNCAGKRGAGILTANCMAGYDTYQFYTTSPPPATLHAPPPRPKTPQLPAPALSSDGPKTPQLPAPALSSDGSKKHLCKLAVIISVTVGSLLVVLLLLGCGFLAFRSRRRPTLETGAMKETQDDLENEYEMTMFNMETLKAATNNFDENLKVGEGGFGAVYKATLRNGKVVAAKRLFLQSVGGKQEFMNEINLLAKIQHRNLINLVGCCTEGSHMILVYEFLPNGSLDKILFDPQKAMFLNWEKRYNIILGTAKGLQYLHEDSKLRIIHRDIKANNILLDENFDAKVADFGLARLFQEDQSHVQTRVAGTYGYMAPEYAMQGQLSSKSDVYSFGVLVVEIVTGKRNSEFGTEMSISSLLGWAWNLYQKGKISMMIDEVVKATGNTEEVKRCIHVALLCTQVDPSLRPPMSTVLLMLLSASVTVPTPTQPAFVRQEYSTSTNPSPTNQHFTNATVSISDIELR